MNQIARAKENALPIVDICSVIFVKCKNYHAFGT